MLFFDTRLEMIRNIVPKHSICVEIGVFEGTFSKQIQDIINPSKLYMIDLFSGICDSGNEDGNFVVKRDLNQCYNNLKEYVQDKPNLVLIKGNSMDILKSFEDNSVDMVYIDGDHSYEGCKRDLEISFQKVKSGGWIMGHDYEMNMRKTRNYYDFGVKKAVDEFCEKRNQTIYAKALDGCVSFAIHVDK